MDVTGPFTTSTSATDSFEKRLSPVNPEHRRYLEEQMDRYFFGDGGEQPEGYVPPRE